MSKFEIGELYTFNTFFSPSGESITIYSDFDLMMADHSSYGLRCQKTGALYDCAILWDMIVKSDSRLRFQSLPFSFLFLEEREFIGYQRYSAIKMIIDNKVVWSMFLKSFLNDHVIKLHK